MSETAEFESFARGTLGDEYEEVMSAMDDEAGEPGDAAEEGSAEPAAEGGQEPAQEPAEGVEEGEEGEEAEPAPAIDDPAAAAAYRMRQQKRDYEERMSRLEEERVREQAQVRQLLEHLVSRQGGAQQPAAADGDKDDNLDDEARKFVDAQTNALMRRFEERYGPPAEGATAESEEARAYAQQQQQAALAEQSRMLRISAMENEYAATPMGRTYMDDVESYVTHAKEYHKNSLGQFGVDDNFVERAALADLRGIVNYAEQVATYSGATVPEVIHSLVKNGMASVAAAPQPAAPAQSPAKKKTSQAVAAAQKVAKQGASRPSGGPAATVQGGLPSLDYIEQVGVNEALSDELLDSLSEGDGNVVDKVLNMLYK